MKNSPINFAATTDKEHGSYVFRLYIFNIHAGEQKLLTDHNNRR